MAKDSIVTANRNEAHRIIRKVMGNVHCLNNDDLKILEFLGEKGFYEDKKVVIIDKGSKFRRIF